MGIFNKLNEPIFLKEESTMAKQLEELKTLRPLLNAEGKIKIDQDIRCLECGMEGENNIAFELKNSHMPMYILHDLFIREGDLSAQIDYIVITRKLIFLIECKKLYGNITIDSNGEFIRSMQYGRSYKKEGIYSPITQNQRHLELIKQKKLNNVSLPQKIIIEHRFHDIYKTVVVLANPKTLLDAKYAKKEIKNQVIRADQLIQYLKTQQEQSKEPSYSDNDMLKKAQQFLSWNEEVTNTYTLKYDTYRIKKSSESNVLEKSKKVPNTSGEPVISGEPVTSGGPVTSVEPVTSGDSVTSVESTASVKAVVSTEPVTDAVNHQQSFSQNAENHVLLVKELKSYRLTKSREENIKPYFIYNDKQLDDLIQKMPHTVGELENVAGFGKVKSEKYGPDIIAIVGKFDKAVVNQ